MLNNFFGAVFLEDVHSITYRVAVGPEAGRKLFSLQTLPACEPDDYADMQAKYPASACMRAWRPGRMSARNWSACAVTSVGQPLQKSGFR